MQIIFSVFMFVVGACMGSFLCCQARRLRNKEKKGKKLGKRSVCLHCGKRLKWWENIPILSWLILKGKCSKCGKKIGAGEFLSEIGVALLLLGISTTINIGTVSVLELVGFVLVILLGLSLSFLAIYDGLYGELPSFMLVIAGVLAIMVAAEKIVVMANMGEFQWSVMLELLGSVAILGGLYLVLYLVSHGKWVGDGDYWLAGIIGVALGNPWLSLVTLFVANFTACIVMYPIVRKRKTSKIYFGPFLVIAFGIVLTFSEQIYGIIRI